MNQAYLQDKMLDAMLDECVDNIEDLLLMVEDWTRGSVREVELSGSY